MKRYRVLLLLTLVFVARSSWADQQSDRERTAYFETHVRPLLANRCVQCHGPKKSESGLRLDTGEALRKGGDSGPAVVPGRPDDSLIVHALRHRDGLEMPPDAKAEEPEIQGIEQWIKSGAFWPKGVRLAEAGPQLRGGAITLEEKSFWSLQPITDPAVPTVDPASRVHNNIDRFVHSRLTEAGLAMNPRADKRTLLRRTTFDLTGLPPTPEAMESFSSDDSPGAYAQVVDRLLETPAYGERWGRHWLDVVRYADTAGETADYPTPLAYKYRNWVINAFNLDLPYDEMVRWQIAGDLLARERIGMDDKQPTESMQQLYRDMVTATGFIAISRRFGFDVENYHHLTIQDTIDVVGQSMLGLTMGCARCHDHKYDPVNMADYYSWYGIFESTRYSFPGSEEKKRPYDLFPAVAPALIADRQAKFDQQRATLEAECQQVEADLKAAGDQSAMDTLKGRLAELASQRQSLDKSGPFPADELIYGAKDGDKPGDARIQLRGEKFKLGETAPRRNLEILGGEMLPSDTGSGRRQLADWLTSPENPLFARVMVNRIWQHHFGRGLVGTENDFGQRGERPSHPELLDWLATRFKESRYSVKAMHRLIMSSAAYRQSSAYHESAAESDPESRLLWRFNRRRLTAEEIRDAMLSVSGNLDPTMGGEHPFPPVDSWSFTQHTPFHGVYPTNRRSIYVMQQRLTRHPFLGLFDGADTNASTARRDLTTVPTQALFLMNNEFVHEQSRGLAKRILAAGDDDSARIQVAYGTVLGRSVQEEERVQARNFLAAYRQAQLETGPQVDAQTREPAVWEGFARTMLTRNEFLFVD